MKRSLLFAVALVAGAMIGPPAQAAPSDNDLGCGFVGVGVPTPAAEYSVTGVLYGGPVLQHGLLTCTVKAGVSTHAGTTPYSASQSQFGNNGVTRIEPSVVGYVSPPEVNTYLCDQFDDGVTTWVFDDTTGSWWDKATNPWATCRLTIGPGSNDPVFDPVFDLVQGFDGLTCPVLATVRGVPGTLEVTSEGDVYLFDDHVYDCPPEDVESERLVSLFFLPQEPVSE